MKRFSKHITKELAKEKGSCCISGQRNITVTCIAPTGGISLLPQNGVSPAIEPYFSEANNIHW